MGSPCKRRRKLQGSWYMDLSYKAQDNAEVVVVFFFEQRRINDPKGLGPIKSHYCSRDNAAEHLQPQ